MFPTMTLTGEKKDIVVQIADIFACTQGIKLPAGVTKFGGLTFDNAGHIVDGQSPVVEGGPWDAYEEVWCAKIRTALKTSEREDLVLLGWKQDGVRDRIDRFLADGGVRKLLNRKSMLAQEFLCKENSVRITHWLMILCYLLRIQESSYSLAAMWNMLYDENSRRITTFLGFDCASVTHPCHEYFIGFDNPAVEFDLGKRMTNSFLLRLLVGTSTKSRQVFLMSRRTNGRLLRRGTPSLRVEI